MRSLKIIILLLVSSSLASFGCSTIMLDKKLLGPVKNQGSAGDCYAFVASDLVSYRLKKKISAAGIMAVNNIRSQTPLEWNGGNVQKAIEYSQDSKVGFCLESQISSRDNIELKTITTNLAKKSRSSKLCEDDIVGLKSFFPTANLRDLLKVADTHAGSTNKIMAAALLKECSPPIRAKFSVAKVFGSKGFLNSIYSMGWSRSSIINKELSRNNPVAITIKIKDFIGPRKKGFHVMSIIGRRKNPSSGSCEYQVRNSWGESCDQYLPHLKKTCRAGNVWVSEEYVNGVSGGRFNVEQLQYIE